MSIPAPTIAYICPSLIGDFFQVQWMAVHHAARAHGVNAVIFSPYLHHIGSEFAGQYRRNFELAHSTRLDGVIVNGASLSVFFNQNELFELLSGFGDAPLITVGAKYEGIPGVVADNAIGIEAIVRHLVSHHGRRRIAFVKGIEGNVDSAERENAFRRQLRDLGIAVDESLVLSGDFSRDAGEQAAARLSERKDGMPDAVVCANDEMAIGVITALTRRGIRVPEDVAVSGYDDIEAATIVNPKVTTVTQEVVAQVEFAVDWLVKAIAAGSKKGDAARYEIPTSARFRDSCGCPTEPDENDVGRDRTFLQQNQYLINERGCEIGEVAHFSKNIMGALSVGRLRSELRGVARRLRLDTIRTVLYDSQADSSSIPAQGRVLFELSSPEETEGETDMALAHSLELPDAGISGRQTLVISELAFGSSYYGYLVVGRSNPEPLVFQMINLELGNFLYTFFLKTRMDAANQKLRAFDALKNDFIANVTHDFRSPLSIILGSAELALLDADPQSEDYERYQVIRDATFKLKDIIDRFLDLTRMDERGVVLRIQRIDLLAYLTAFTDIYRSSLAKSLIRFEVDFPAEAPAEFWSDPEKLDQILSNLVSNALKFIDPEGGTIRLKLSDTATHVTVEVIDNGVGIPAEKLESIFERFTQLGDTRSQRLRGTGIGLAFSRTLATHLKGTLRAVSEGPGKGSSFVLSLPKGRSHFSDGDLVVGEGMSRESPYDRRKVRSQAAVQVHELVPHSLELHLPPGEIERREFTRKEDALILIIEDNPAILNLERACLAREGYRYFILASTGTKGLDAALHYRPDLVVCDVNLPDLPGDQLYAKLIDEPGFGRTPFVFVSAVGDREFIRRLRDRGAEAFLLKPIDTEEFALTVNLHVRSVLERQKDIGLAQLDGLTGLQGRRSLLRNVEAQFQSRHYRDFSFIFIDVDHFKSINDNYGHHAGDLVLCSLAAEIQAALRPYDIVGRYGGEEFLILLPDTGLVSAMTVAEKLRVRAESMTLESEGKNIRTTVSLGISSLRDHEHLLPQPASAPSWREVFEPDAKRLGDWDAWKRDIQTAFETLIKGADQAMYSAKRAGRNRLGVFE